MTAEEEDGQYWATYYDAADGQYWATYYDAADDQYWEAHHDAEEAKESEQSEAFPAIEKPHAKGWGSSIANIGNNAFRNKDRAIYGKSDQEFSVLVICN